MKPFWIISNRIFEILLTSRSRRKLFEIVRRILKPIILEVVDHDFRVWGPKERLLISSKAYVSNTLFNTVSGRIQVDDFTFTAHNVSILTGTHEYEQLFEKRRLSVPVEGRDIIIGKGVWIGSNATILGPCVIGDHAVIAAGSLVKTNVLPGVVVAGVPAKAIKSIPLELPNRISDD